MARLMIAVMLVAAVWSLSGCQKTAKQAGVAGLTQIELAKVVYGKLSQNRDEAAKLAVYVDPRAPWGKELRSLASHGGNAEKVGLLLASCDTDNERFHDLLKGIKPSFDNAWTVKRLAKATQDVADAAAIKQSTGNTFPNLCALAAKENTKADWLAKDAEFHSQQLTPECISLKAQAQQDKFVADSVFRTYFTERIQGDDPGTPLKD